MDVEITKSEAIIMMIIWEKDGDLTMPEILAEANKRYNREWKPQTVSTFLNRLVKKDCLQMYRKGREFFYHKLISKEEYREKTLREFVEFWCEGDVDLCIELVKGLKA